MNIDPISRYGDTIINAVQHSNIMFGIWNVKSERIRIIPFETCKTSVPHKRPVNINPIVHNIQSVAKESWHFVLPILWGMDGAKIFVFGFFIINEDFSKFWYQTWTHSYVQLIIYSLIMRGYKIVMSQMTLRRN